MTGQTVTREMWDDALQQANLMGPLTDAAGQPLTKARLKELRARAYDPDTPAPTHRDKGSGCAQPADGPDFLPGKGCAYCGLARDRHKKRHE